MSNWIGQTLGNYAIEKQLGQGGTGAVFKALDTRLHRHVAIKILDPEFSANPRFVEAFRKTAAASADLRHPNIITLHDIGEQQGVHYMVMEYLRGVTLDTWLRKNKKMTMRQVARVARQLGNALDYAHKKGIIHCDIKSSNIMLGRDGHVTILDFGLAQARKFGQQTASTGATPAYMSPDQALNRPLDARTDIYSMGVVLYELLAGQVPFERTEPAAAVYAHVRETPHPIGNLPTVVSQVILKALEKLPDRRQQSAGELAADLERAVNQSLTFPTIQMFSLLGVAGIVLIVLMVVLIKPSSPSPTPTLPPPIVTNTPSPTRTTLLTPTRSENFTPKPTKTPTHGVTATLRPPITSTPTVAPAASKAPTSTPTVSSVMPVPRNLNPTAGITVLGSTHFSWTYDGPPLQENQAFEVRIWKRDSSSDHNGVVDPVSTNSVDIDMERFAQQYGTGAYSWAVAVIQIDPYKKIGLESTSVPIMVETNTNR